MNKILTVLIPTFNMEKYLDLCLSSLLIEKNLERLDIIVINDGSTDMSSSIAHKYAETYPTVFKVIDKENGNYGSCINRGLKEATGKYIKVLDADDSFNKENFEKYIACLSNIDVDLVLTDYIIVNENNEQTNYCRYDLQPNTFTRIEDICNTATFLDMQMHGVTYRRQILIDMGYTQSEGISYTDQEWIFSPMIRVKHAYYYDQYIYKYLVGREGQTISTSVSMNSWAHTRKCIYGMINAYNKYKEEIPMHITEYLHYRLIRYIKYVYVYTLTNYSYTLKNDLIEFDNNIKRLNNDIYLLVEKNNKFNYIGYWRKHQQSNLTIIRLIARTYLYINKKIHYFKK